jgi:hypothetical protein
MRLSAAAPIVEKITGEMPAKSSLYRWSRVGIRGIRLKCVYALGAQRTCEDWVREFFAAVAVAAELGEVPTQTDAARNRRANAELDRELAGI